ncbi:MAG: hypothetical protein V4681_02120 [Patescibacteria group bacterium]
MNKKLLILIASIVLLALAAVAFLLLRTPSTGEPEQPDGGTLFPGGGNILPGTPVTGRMMIYGRGDTEFEVNDFMHDQVTVADVVNPGNYVLAGELGYCLADGTCPRGADTPTFSISFNDEDDTFNIVLLAEPLGEVRRAAETHLQSRLGLSNEVMCELNYYVGTPSFVNASYSNGNMGFSYCSGAVKLP